MTTGTSLTILSKFSAQHFPFDLMNRSHEDQQANGPGVTYGVQTYVTPRQ
ncbi:MAG: hypothetical protein Nkreftii_003106 [Candidatus Nitrospira kreftii]|uniref:Uncharacterized protein n=1 Tax=Candidatus Nitrospira kreftii TaxID=2652173 RepID=A0A7S8FGF5_9BACT|nr:MAG: hypothetical protein Nkreftii_003106 [Candidatus Nitrospira kreftii]